MPPNQQCQWSVERASKTVFGVQVEKQRCVLAVLDNVLSQPGVCMFVNLPDLTNF